MNLFIPLLALLMPLNTWANPTISATELSPIVVANPMQVQSVSVVLSGTTGFARDAALEQAARQALPKVLQTEMFGLSATEATAKTKALGAVLPFVARYNIVTERVVPEYSLIADLTFNEAKLRQNFGAQAAATAPVVASVSGTENAPATTTTRWLVRITEPSPAAQDKARRLLAALPNTHVSVHEIARAEVAFAVTTAQPEAALSGALSAWQPQILPLTELAEPNMSTPAQPVMPNFPDAERAARPADPRTTPAWLPDFW